LDGVLGVPVTTCAYLLIKIGATKCYHFEMQRNALKHSELFVQVCPFCDRTHLFCRLGPVIVCESGTVFRESSCGFKESWTVWAKATWRLPTKNRTYSVPRITAIARAETLYQVVGGFYTGVVAMKEFEDGNLTDVPKRLLSTRVV
jgi:hypothetical protein